MLLPLAVKGRIVAIHQLFCAIHFRICGLPEHAAVISKKKHMKALLLLLAVCWFVQVKAMPFDSSDHAILLSLRTNGLKLETNRAVFYFEDVNVNREAARLFIADVTKGIAAIEAFTGRTFDKAHYGSSKIEYYISTKTTVSHVYNGYHHNEGKAIPAIFFSSKRFEKNALPYLHETTHLILREFHSLWLREGMAEWVAKQVARQLGKGHVAFYGDGKHADVHQLAAGIPQHNAKDVVLRTIGMNGIPSFKNTEVRRLFYIGSTSFVDYLSAMLTKKRLLGLYEATDTKAVLEQLVEKRMEDIKADWLQCIEQSIAVQQN
jgi:hypothetical protein